MEEWVGQWCYKEQFINKFEAFVELKGNSILVNVVETLNEIEIKLKEIGERTTYNSSLWIFVYYRSYGFDDVLSDLKLLKGILDQRKTELFEIVKINQFLSQSTDVKKEWIDVK